MNRPETKPVSCPRCRRWTNILDALSRTDNDIMICASCGTDEAMRDWARTPLPSQGFWPVML